MADRWKRIVTSGLAFGALAIPGFAAFVAVRSAVMRAMMQAVAGAFAVYHIIRSAVDYLHGAMAGAIVLSFLVRARHRVGAAALASVALDSALAPNSVDPGVTFTAPIHDSIASLYVHVGRDSDMHGLFHQSTQAGLRLHAPAYRGRVQPYVAIGFEHLVTGALDLADLLALKLQPGVRIYVRDSWGVGFRTPPIRISS